LSESIIELEDLSPGKGLIDLEKRKCERGKPLYDLHVNPSADIPVKLFSHIGPDHCVKELVCQPKPEKKVAMFLLPVYR
jgi:hypothetical protein